MKKILMQNIVLLFSTGLLAQEGVIKLYAYSRNTIPGIRQEVLNDSDTASQKRESPFDVAFFLYAEVKKGTKLSVSGVWIRGKYYTATAKKVSTPVLTPANKVAVMKQKDVLVNKTLNDVFAIQPVETISHVGLNENEKLLMKANELVIAIKLSITRAAVGRSLPL